MDRAQSLHLRSRRQPRAESATLAKSLGRDEPGSLGWTRAGGVRLFLLFLQGKDFLGCGSAIRVMLMLRVFELCMIFFHMLFVLLLVQLVLVLR